jgi:hypothetical protein
MQLRVQALLGLTGHFLGDAVGFSLHLAPPAAFLDGLAMALHHGPAAPRARLRGGFPKRTGAHHGESTSPGHEPFAGRVFYVRCYVRCAV